MKIHKYLMALLLVCSLMGACAPKNEIVDISNIPTTSHSTDAQTPIINDETQIETTDETEMYLVYTKDNPLTNPQQIIPVLEALQEKSSVLFEQPTWWLLRQEVIKEYGELQSLPRETWFKAPQIEGECTQWMVTVKGKSNNEIAQYIIQLSDGNTADLVELRKGIGQVKSAKDVGTCLTFPDNGDLADLLWFLRGEKIDASKDERTLKEIHAWYENQQNLIIRVTWQLSGENADKQVDTYTIETSTGMIMQHDLVMLYKDLSVMGELDWTFEHTQLELPQQVAEQFEAATNELKSYIK